MNSPVKFCDNCGATNRSDAKFCYACGQPQIAYGDTTTTATGLLVVSHQLKQRYAIIEKLGQGGFGAIYKAEDALFNNAIRAVKEMSMRGMNAQETQDAIEAFRNEALLLANLSHPNLPRIYDHFEEYGRWYLVMDYIDGETLEKRLERTPGGKLPVAGVIAIALQLCTVLAYLHSHQPPIIFRDLKPDNVMMTNDNHLYLIDFGIARFFKPGQARDTVNLGTPGYAAPEQYGRMQTTIRSDIYSLGATLYHLLSGTNPGLTPFLFLPLELDPLLPGNPELETLIMQMLEMKENKRPADTDVVRQELQRIQSMYQLQQVSVLPVIAVQPVSTLPIINMRATLLPPDQQTSLIVAQNGGGQYTTLSEAIRNAPANAFLLVQEGVYKESLLLDRDITIVGSGSKERIILEGTDRHCVLMQTNSATLRGLTLRCQAGRENNQYSALAIPQGQLFIEDCDINSNSSACIAIQNATTKATIRYCTIHSGVSHGIAIFNNAQGTLEYCDILQNSDSGIKVTAGGNAIVRHCTIHHNQGHALFISNNGQGTFEDCEFYNNGRSGAAITFQSNPLLLRCQLHHNQHYGVEIYQDGKGSYQDCGIYANTSDNVRIATESTPYFYLCNIHDSEQSGITVTNNGKGTIEYCDISANSAANVTIMDGGNPFIRYSKIHAGKQSGIRVSDKGQGKIERCAIMHNTGKALDISPSCNVILKSNQIGEILM
jgi:F-box protein 11